MHTYNEKLRNNSILRARKRELRFGSRSMRLISSHLKNPCWVILIPTKSGEESMPFSECGCFAALSMTYLQSFAVISIFEMASSQTQHVCSDLKSTQFSAIKTLGANLLLACKNPSESNYGTFFNSGYICDISDLVILSIRGER